MPFSIIFGCFKGSTDRFGTNTPPSCPPFQSQSAAQPRNLSVLHRRKLTLFGRQGSFSLKCNRFPHLTCFWSGLRNLIVYHGTALPHKRGDSHFCGLEESFPTKMAVCASPVADSAINNATEQDHLCFLYQTAEPAVHQKTDRTIWSTSETDI